MEWWDIQLQVSGKLCGERCGFWPIWNLEWDGKGKLCGGGGKAGFIYIHSHRFPSLFIISHRSQSSIAINPAMEIGGGGNVICMIYHRFDNIKFRIKHGTRSLWIFQSRKKKYWKISHFTPWPCKGFESICSHDVSMQYQRENAWAVGLAYWPPGVSLSLNHIPSPLKTQQSHFFSSPFDQYSFIFSKFKKTLKKFYFPSLQNRIREGYVRTT